MSHCKTFWANPCHSAILADYRAWLLADASAEFHVFYKYQGHIVNAANLGNAFTFRGLRFLWYHHKPCVWRVTEVEILLLRCRKMTFSKGIWYFTKDLYCLGCISFTAKLKQWLVYEMSGFPNFFVPDCLTVQMSPTTWAKLEQKLWIHSPKTNWEICYALWSFGKPWRSLKDR